MNYGNIKYHDIANGLGIRTSLFVSGCTHHCRGCFQPETWDFAHGKVFTSETCDSIVRSLRGPEVRGLTLLGGEPFEPSNQEVLVRLLRRVRAECPSKDVWCYSGYTWEELTGESRARCAVTDEMLSMIDVLVDGEFVDTMHSVTLVFKGSSNQRVIDVKASLGSGAIVPYKL